MIVLLLSGWAMSAEESFNTSARSQKAVARVKPGLEKRLAKLGVAWGSPVFLRLFKEDHTLELWVQKEKMYVMFHTYKICYFSGELGPKLKEGDQQAPEGFYAVRPKLMNPWSSYHLSFNIGYPNRYDRYHGRTGSLIMIHGNCVSIGCYAMTDKQIDEIYALVEAALKGGQSQVPTHIFPFRLEGENLARIKGRKWTDFWNNLKTGYDWFEKKRCPPRVGMSNGRYSFLD